MPMGRGHRNCPSLSATMTESNGRCCGNLGSHVAEHGFDLLACHQGEREGHSWGKCAARLDQNAGPCCCNHLSVPSPVPWPITTSMKWCFLLKSTGSWFGVLSPQPFPGLQASLFIPPAALGFCHFFLQACSYAVNLWLLKHLAIGGIRRNALQLLAALGLARPVLKPVVQDLSKFHIMPQSAPGGDYATALLLVAATGVQAWAQIPEKHSERDVHKVVQRQGTRLEVPMICLSLLGERVPYIDPRAWAEFIIGRGLSSMFAGLSPDQNHLSPIMWRSFWNQFYKLNPHHPVFEESDFNENDWGYTIGLYIHGDEGRTLKKSGLMVTALQSCLGKGFDNKRLKRDAFGDFKPQVNFTGHTFTNRFVNFVMPKTLYATKPDIYHEALAELSKSLRSLFDSGITDPVTKQHYRFVVLGCKGDLPYLAKAGFLNRTFNTGTKTWWLKQGTWSLSSLYGRFYWISCRRNHNVYSSMAFLYWNAASMDENATIHSISSLWCSKSWIILSCGYLALLTFGVWTIMDCIYTQLHVGCFASLKFGS